MGSRGWEEVGSRGWEEVASQSLDDGDQVGEEDEVNGEEAVAPQSLDGDHGDRGDHDDGVHLVHPSASHDGGGRNVPIPGRVELYQFHSMVHPLTCPLGQWMAWGLAN